MVAFMIGQLIDVVVFHRIRKRTGEKHVWLRATGSTAVSQLVDSFVVLYIAFVIGPQHWSISLFLAVGTVNYAVQDARGDRADAGDLCGKARARRVSRP